MKRLIIIMIFSFATFAALSAQTEKTADTPTDTTPAEKPADTPAEKPAEKPKSNFDYEPIRAGDQYIRVSLGAAFPLFILGSAGANTETNMYTGATGTIGYSRYITPHIALGGELAFAFNSTLAENLYFYLPIVFNGTYEFVFDRIHVPLTLSGGFAFQTYDSLSYFGPILRPEAGVWYQYSPEWSFGIGAAWNIIPQLYQNTQYDRTGNILDATLGFRYHF